MSKWTEALLELEDVMRAAVRVSAARLDASVTAADFADQLDRLIEQTYEAGYLAGAASEAAPTIERTAEPETVTVIAAAAGAPGPLEIVSVEQVAGLPGLTPPPADAPEESYEEHYKPETPAAPDDTPDSVAEAMRALRQAEAERAQETPEQAAPKKQRRLSYDEKVRIRDRYDNACEANHGRPPRGFIANLSVEYGVSTQTIYNALRGD